MTEKKHNLINIFVLVCVLTQFYIFKVAKIKKIYLNLPNMGLKNIFSVKSQTEITENIEGKCVGLKRP